MVEQILLDQSKKNLNNANIDMHILCIEHKYFDQVTLLFNEG
jgi:hypothetical protein